MTTFSIGTAAKRSVRERAAAAGRASDRSGDAQPATPWRPEPDGAVAADTGTLRLVVHPQTPGGYARFLVLGGAQPDPGGRATGRRALLASGTEASVAAAMQAAERTAVRFAPRQG